MVSEIQGDGADFNKHFIRSKILGCTFGAERDGSGKGAWGAAPCSEGFG